MRVSVVGILMAVTAVAGGCGSGDDGPVAASSVAPVSTAAAPTVDPTTAAVKAPTEQVVVDESVDAERFPVVVAVTATPSGPRAFRFDVTLSSEYDTPQRYADAWRVLDADDVELGVRVLTHDHAGEQPFTRSTTVEVPAGVTTVFIEGRDQLNGWSGQRFELTLAGG